MLLLVVAFFALIWDHFFALRKGFSSSSAFFVSAIRPVSSSGGGNVPRASFLIAASFCGVYRLSGCSLRWVPV